MYGRKFMKTYLTLDVGGSAIKYALLQEDLTILEKSSVPTPMDTLENFIETIGKIYDQFQDQINGMALSMPGICATPTSRTTWSNQARLWCVAKRWICARSIFRSTSTARAKTISCRSASTGAAPTPAPSTCPGKSVL